MNETDTQRRAGLDGIGWAAVALTVIAFAGSFTHVRDVVDAHGQHGWLAWAIAAMPEISVLLCVLRLRRGGAAAQRVWSWLVLVTSATFTLSANLAQAEHTVWGWLVAGWPAWASIGATGLIEIGTHRATDPTEVAPVEAPEVPEVAPVEVPEVPPVVDRVVLQPDPTELVVVDVAPDPGPVVVAPVADPAPVAEADPAPVITPDAVPDVAPDAGPDTTPDMVEVVGSVVPELVPVQRVRPARTAPARSSGASTREKVAKLRARYPEWTAARIAERAGVSERQVRRYLTEATRSEVVEATPQTAPAGA